MPLTTVIVLSKLVRGGRGGAWCLSLSSMVPKQLRDWFTYERHSGGDMSPEVTHTSEEKLSAMMNGCAELGTCGVDGDQSHGTKSL